MRDIHRGGCLVVPGLSRRIDRRPAAGRPPSDAQMDPRAALISSHVPRRPGRLPSLRRPVPGGRPNPGPRRSGSIGSDGLRRSLKSFCLAPPAHRLPRTPRLGRRASRRCSHEGHPAGRPPSLRMLTCRTRWRVHHLEPIARVGSSTWRGPRLERVAQGPAFTSIGQKGEKQNEL